MGALSQSDIHICSILIISIVKGVIIPTGRNRTFNRNSTVRIAAVARHIGSLAQNRHLRNRVHIDRHGVARLATVLVGHGHDIVRGVRRRGRHRLRIRSGESFRRCPFVTVRSHAAAHYRGQGHTLTQTDGGVILGDGNRQFFGQGDVNRYGIGVAAKVCNFHYDILFLSSGSTRGGCLTCHRYLFSRRAVVGHTAQDGVG